MPFGTGKAVQDYLVQGKACAYPWPAFLDLKSFFDQLPEIYRHEDFFGRSQVDSLPDSILSFLKKKRFGEALGEIRENTSSEPAFQKRFFRWFNGFLAMKFIHYARDHYYGKGKVTEEAKKLLALLPGGDPGSADLSVRELLRIYRRIERGATRLDERDR